MRVLKLKDFMSRQDFKAARASAVVAHNAAFDAEKNRPSRWSKSNADHYARGRHKFANAANSVIGAAKIAAAIARRLRRGHS